MIFNRKKTNKIRFGSLYGHQNRCASESVVLGLVSTGEITTDSKSHIKMVKLPFAKFYTHDIQTFILSSWIASWSKLSRAGMDPRQSNQKQDHRVVSRTE